MKRTVKLALAVITIMLYLVPTVPIYASASEASQEALVVIAMLLYLVPTMPTFASEGSQEVLLERIDFELVEHSEAVFINRSLDKERGDLIIGLIFKIEDSEIRKGYLEEMEIIRKGKKGITKVSNTWDNVILAILVLGCIFLTVRKVKFLRFMFCKL